MAKSTQIQSRISAIAKDLANGKERAELLRKYAKKWQIAERTIDRYITDAKNEAQTLRNLAKETANDTLVEEVKEAVRNGLKTKTERLMILQKEVDNCLIDLANDELDTYEKVALRKVIKDLQAEISKIEGDYAPTKAEVTGKDGRPLPTAPAPIVFLSADKLSDEQLQQIIKTNEPKEYEGE